MKKYDYCNYSHAISDSFSFNNQPQIIHKRGFKSYQKIRAMLPIR